MNLNATLFVQCGVFFILSYFTMKFVWPPLVAALDERAKKIQNGLEFARRAEQDLKDAEAQAKTLMQLAGEESRGLLEKASHQANQIVSDARRDAEHLLSKAKKDAMSAMELAIQDAQKEIRIEALSLAVIMARQILEKEISEKDHKAILARVSRGG